MSAQVQQQILFWVQVVSLIALVVYVIKTGQMAKATEASVAEMRNTRDQESAPYVTTYFDIPMGSQAIYLVVKNTGQTLATNVKLSFAPPLRVARENYLPKDWNLIKDGIESLPPGYEIRTLFDSAVLYFGRTELPLKYEVTITYFGGIQPERRVLRQTLDLSAYKGLLQPNRKRMDDLVAEMEGLAKTLSETGKSVKRAADALEQGVLIRNPTITISTIEPGMAEWEEPVLAKAGEFENLWAAGKGGPPGHLQAYALLISDQLMALLANRPKNADPEVVGKVSEVSNQLQMIGRMTLYLDGGESFAKFQSLGDDVIRLIREMRQRDAGDV